MATPSDVKKLAEGVWAVEGESKLMPGFFLPLRCTIVRGADGGLLLYSPIPLSEDAVEDDDDGEVVKLAEVDAVVVAFAITADTEFQSPASTSC